jgi:hypothetical protein
MYALEPEAERWRQSTLDRQLLEGKLPPLEREPTNVHDPFQKFSMTNDGQSACAG